MSSSSRNETFSYIAKELREVFNLGDREAQLSKARWKQ